MAWKDLEKLGIETKTEKHFTPLIKKKEKPDKKSKVSIPEDEVLIVWKNKKNKIKSDILRAIFLLLTGVPWRENTDKLVNALQRILKQGKVVDSNE